MCLSGERLCHGEASPGKVIGREVLIPVYRKVQSCLIAQGKKKSGFFVVAVIVAYIVTNV